MPPMASPLGLELVLELVLELGAGAAGGEGRGRGPGEHARELRPQVVEPRAGARHDGDGWRAEEIRILPPHLLGHGNPDA